MVGAIELIRIQDGTPPRCGFLLLVLAAAVI
jgi:hypothetical protein